MNKTLWFLFGYIVNGILIVGYLLISDNSSYKQGQIDALTGNIKYELQIQPDSTIIWVEKE